MDKTFDVVVVGSGAGGGAAAKELADLCRHGLRVAVLEWGPRLKDADFTGREVEMARRLYFGGGGVLTKDKSMTLAFAKAYGGSTVVYTGTSLVVPSERLASWGIPGLDWGDLMVRSAKYLVENNVHMLEPELINDNNRLFVEGCRELGYRAAQFPVNLKDCSGTGLCNLGCAHGAKQGTHKVQLPAAERHGVEVITGCRVERVGDRVLHAVVSDVPGAGPWPPGRYRIRAKAVVLAAGAVNTPALLLRSGFDLPALGRYFLCHPALILVGQHDRPITNYWGHPKSFYCDQFAEDENFLLETCMYFPFTTAKSLAGFGPEHSRLMSRMDRLQMILALALDEAVFSNRVGVDRAGEPVVDYRLTEPTIRSLVGAMRAATRIFFAAGAARVHSPAGRKFFIERGEEGALDEMISREHFLPGKVPVTAAHLMGGCRMGAGPEDSVTDSWGQVHGVPWLFVADASLFPRSPGINPYITIMALADRVAERVRERARELVACAPPEVP